MKKILLLGSGELGKEFVISAQRKGQYIIACDSYAGAPAMQVADEYEVFSMLDGDALERVANTNRISLFRKSRPSVQNAFTILRRKVFRWYLVPVL